MSAATDGEKSTQARNAVKAWTQQPQANQTSGGEAKPQTGKSAHEGARESEEFR